MRQVPGGIPELAPRVTGRVRRAVAGDWGGVRAAERRTVVAEALLCALTAAFGLVPLALVPPERPALAVLEALWAVLLVPARRGRPVAAVLGASVLLVGDNVWTLAVVPLVVLSATRRIAPPRRAWQVVGVACAVVGILTVVRALVGSGSGSESLPLALAGNAVSVVLLLVLPALAGTLLGRRRPLVSLLRERNAYLEQTRTLTAVAARMEERNRIAGEMHDLLGHRLSLISVHAGALELAAARKAPPLVGQAELLRTTAGTAMEELREILGVLRHADLTDETGGGSGGGGDRGTRADITDLVTESRRTGGTIELDWSVDDSAEVDVRTRQAIHRVVREGLTNVLKHASGAPTRVEVRDTGKGIEVSVTNEAPRTADHSGGGNHSGLAGLHERISLLGGTFEAGVPLNGGFRVAAWLPAHGDRPVPVLPVASVQNPGPGGARAPLSDEVLTWPRVLGSGCVALLVVLPTVGFLVVLLTLAALK
ncbi:histidine kinase [Streptomyces sp. NPDC020898]|uniref:histidine kinase n=1 Tax=Streptomyces sp. NPDC020898 TaxID=3365101 RepID=UPI0037917530